MLDLSDFDKKLATPPDSQPLGPNEENTVSKESLGNGEDDRSEGLSKDSDSWNLSSSLTHSKLDMLVRAYGIPSDVVARLARPDENTRSPAGGYVAVYKRQFKFGMKFLIVHILKK